VNEPSVGYVVFDLETEAPPGPLDLDRHVPAITVAATMGAGGEPRLWHERGPDGRATGSALGRQAAQALVQYLLDAAQAGHTIVTWNGAGFDFRVLAQASGWVDACVELAWGHLDLMFWFHCANGYSVGLDRAAQAVGSGKTQGMDGQEAARLWGAGEYERVLEYAAQDVRALAAIYEGVLRSNALRWINTRGRLSRAAGPLLAVRDAYRLPPPDTSWMRRAPWPREKFVGWMLARG
jgi:hypothetical protein